MRVLRYFAASCILFGLTQASFGQLLYSWEGNLEGWVADAGFSIANSGGAAGVTDGSNSLAATIPTQGFQRWGRVQMSGQPFDDLVAAAANPLLYRLEFDVTYDTSSIPQGSVTFVSQQLAFNTSQGWSQVDFGLTGSGQENQTLTMKAPLSRFSSVKPNISSATAIISSNSNWGDSLAGTIYYDNFRITEIVPDLNVDGDIDPSDWSIFIGHHLADLGNVNSDESFLLGDLDGDIDNDFNDLLIFEAAYDNANGTGAFSRMVPEPAGVVVGLACGGLLWGLRRRSKVLCLTAMLSVLAVGSSQAQLLHSFETDLEGWAETTFQAVPATVSQSTLAATDGSHSLAIEQIEDGFNWAANVTYGNGSANYTALNNAANIGIANFQLEFDVTYDTASIPDFFVTYLNLSIAMNSDGGWIQYDGLGLTDGLTDETVHVQIPLNQAINPPGNTTGDGVIVPNSSFYQINLGLNGDWGLDPATLYFDNFQLVQVSEPDVLQLVVDRSNGEVRMNNSSGAADFTLNYYTLTSSGGSLSSAGWNSFDDQNLDAVDGPDPGSVAGDSVLEGWDEAGGSGATVLAEAFLLGSSTIMPGVSPTLGAAYNNRVDAQDLVFQYRDLTDPGRLQIGDVVYVGEPPSISGDFDNNGDYACADVDALVAVIVAGSNDPQYDLTQDGVVDRADLTAWLAEAGGAENPSGNPYLPGDASLDGTVDGQDFLAWNTNKFTSTPAWCAGDFNADGNIDGGDFLIWNSNKFTSSDVQAVPEPVAAASLMVLLALAWFVGQVVAAFVSSFAVRRMAVRLVTQSVSASLRPVRTSRPWARPMYSIDRLSWGRLPFASLTRALAQAI